MFEPSHEPELAAQIETAEVAAAAPTPFADWLARGLELDQLQQRLSWAIADWAAAGMLRHPFDLKGLPTAAPFDARSVRKAAKIALAFPANGRDSILPFEVHAILTRLPAEERGDVFAAAKEARWSAREARKAVEAQRQASIPFQDNDPERLATHIYRAWNNAPAEIREHAWPLLQAGARRGFNLIDEDEAIS